MTAEDGMSLVRSISEAYRSYEEVPRLRAEIDRLTQQSVADGETIAKREIRIAQLNTELASITEKLRSVEAERDEVGFRLLEAEDKSVATLRLLQVVRQEVNDLIVGITGSEKTDMVFMSVVERREWEARKAEFLAPPTPQGMVGLSGSTPSAEFHTGPVKPANTQASVDQSSAALIEALPSPFTEDEVHSPSAVSSGEDTAAPSSAIGCVSPGERESDPTQPSEALGEGSIAQIGDDERIHGPYFGKRYHDHPVYVELSRWLNGGGTEADYNWRPGRA